MGADEQSKYLDITTTCTGGNDWLFGGRRDDIFLLTPEKND